MTSAVPNRVMVTRAMLDVKTAGLYAICTMQVCAVSDATDEEILEVCNRENLRGTTKGWCEVIREDRNPYSGPIACEDDPGRQHLLVVC